MSDAATQDRPSITMKPVESSQIAEVGYDAASNTLAIRFKSKGALYHYSDFTQADWEKLQAAHSLSVGKHFYAHIKGKFAYTKIEERP